MKKTLSIILALCLTLTCLFTCLTASAEGAIASIEAWELTDIARSDIEQGKLITTTSTNVTLAADGTYAITMVGDTLYSSDGGETYVPSMYLTIFAYGTYEVVEIDEDLGDVIIRILSLDRVALGDYDSAVKGTEEDFAAMAAHPFIGTEIVLGGDHKVAEISGMMDFLEIAHFVNPYQ